MIGNNDNSEDSPKRRSTFYVSLEGETRNQHHTKITKCLSQDPDKYACNTFPISGTKNPPSTILTRTFSNSDGIGKRPIEPSVSTLAGTRGNVQSLTRMFETPAIVVDTADDTSTSQRKKVERTRSFKTIERFQNRFVGKKELDPRKDVASRLNNTIGCLDTESSSTERRKRKDEVRSKFVKAQLPNRQANISNESDNSSGTTLGNLLIRRTHSTKISRSASALVKSSGRHGDCTGDFSTEKNSLHVNESDVESANHDDVDESAFEEAAIHSGKFLSD